MKSRSYSHRAAMLLATAVLIGLPVGVAHAYSYGPETDAEWMGWPEHCKVRYTVSDGGRASAYTGARSPEAVAMWQDRFGECWGYLHHHCGSLLQLQRAKAARTPQARKFALDLALGEDKLALSVCPASNPFFSEIRTHMGFTLMEMGDTVSASKAFESAVAAHPGYGPAYVAQSTLLRKQKNHAAAFNALLAGSEATGGQSPELENALGLAYFEQKNFEKAREHARNAYARGYPLPALRDKLAKAGYSL